MSTSFLYHSNSVRGVQYKTTRYEGRSMIFEAELRRDYVRCPSCSHHAFHHSKGNKQRQLRLLPIGSKSCFLNLTIHRLQCINCRHIWWPQPGFAAGKRRMTKSLVNYIVELMKMGTVKAVANLVGVSWDTVKDIHKETLQRSYRTVEYKKLRYIGIDEFSISKGHEYMTIITDLEEGRIIHAVEGRDKKTVMPFLRKLARRAVNLKAIAMDMSGPYESAVKEVLPHVMHVFDHYHVSALINRSIDEVRREQQQRCERAGLRAIKGLRFVLLMNYEKLNTPQQNGLQHLLEVNAPLAIAHTMKEQFRVFWLKKTFVEGAQFILRWLLDVEETGIHALISVARTLLHHAEGLLNYFHHPISNAVTEGINNKIKTLKRQAYGYRDMAYFKLRLYHLHNQTYSLTG
jgi:transposase